MPEKLTIFVCILDYKVDYGRFPASTGPRKETNQLLSCLPKTTESELPQPYTLVRCQSWSVGQGFNSTLGPRFLEKWLHEYSRVHFKSMTLFPVKCSGHTPLNHTGRWTSGLAQVNFCLRFPKSDSPAHCSGFKQCHYRSVSITLDWIVSWCEWLFRFLNCASCRVTIMNDLSIATVVGSKMFSIPQPCIPFRFITSQLIFLGSPSDPKSLISIDSSEWSQSRNNSLCLVLGLSPHKCCRRKPIILYVAWMTQLGNPWVKFFPTFHSCTT